MIASTTARVRGDQVVDLARARAAISSPLPARLLAVVEEVARGARRRDAALFRRASGGVRRLGDGPPLNLFEPLGGKRGAVAQRGLDDEVEVRLQDRHRRARRRHALDFHHGDVHLAQRGGRVGPPEPVERLAAERHGDEPAA